MRGLPLDDFGERRGGGVVRNWAWRSSLALVALLILASISTLTASRWDPNLHGRFAEWRENGKELQFTAMDATARDTPTPLLTPTEFGPPLNALEELQFALETMQSEYFQIWLGKWPTSIDWTGAVLGTFVSASLISLTQSLEYVLPPSTTQSLKDTVDGEKVENEINRYFTQAVAYYFGEDAFAIRLQAYDDMLWVVLGWLEGIRFVEKHSSAHYSSDTQNTAGNWYGKQFVPSFAHRANVFYDITTGGWDTRLCGGGMVWNPRLTPYKNAITNQLYISASVGMYLYFPGDTNSSPYQHPQNLPTRPHHPIHLANAVRAYNWLKSSNMTNDHGLYVDGFHIAGWSRNGSIGTGNCDVRNEMVYTYNQGVLLSGLRGLWESTGHIEYLKDGHELVRNVLAATGWNGAGKDREKQWSGLGRNGILEEVCDASGSCSQNGQTFKGIFMHHLTAFCELLPRTPRVPGLTFAADEVTASLHRASCKEYAPWVVWNARAALGTRDTRGRFGMWWGAPDWSHGEVDADVEVPVGAEDYRNEGLGEAGVWGKGWDTGLSTSSPSEAAPSSPQEAYTTHADDQIIFDPFRQAKTAASTKWDLNDRGRGRTVETQGGGVAVVRAMWEFVRLYTTLEEEDGGEVF